MAYREHSTNTYLGRSGEQRVEDFLRQRLLYVTRLCQIHNADGIGAPMLMGARCNLILPDFQIIDPRKFGQPYYVEVKTKTNPGWYARKCTHTHAVDTPDWRHYRSVHSLSGLPVWLLVLEDMSGELLGLPIHRVEPDHFSGPNRAFTKGGAYWLKSQFTLIAQLERRQARLDI